MAIPMTMTMGISIMRKSTEQAFLEFKDSVRSCDKKVRAGKDVISIRDAILGSALVDPSAALPATGSLLLTTPRIRPGVSHLQTS